MKALTANRLDDGETVFWKDDGWVDRFHLAQIWDDASDAAAEAAEAHAKSLLKEVVDPYLIDVEPVEGGVAPVSYRERVRALGPTNKPDHGKQAEHGLDVELMAHAHGAARSTGRVNLIKRK
jgi:sulfite reductase (NADPH) hemoprotein beta-component